MIKTENNSMADYFVMSKRNIKSQFFTQINTIIDWKPITKIIEKHYKKGVNVCGCSAYSGLILFKMSLLQTWFGLSDYEVEVR